MYVVVYIDEPVAEMLSEGSSTLAPSAYLLSAKMPA
jgi:hypothetical protein